MRFNILVVLFFIMTNVAFAAKDTSKFQISSAFLKEGHALSS